jgi:hypothetical protein
MQVLAGITDLEGKYRLVAPDRIVSMTFGDNGGVSILFDGLSEPIQLDPRNARAELRNLLIRDNLALAMKRLDAKAPGSTSE